MATILERVRAGATLLDSTTPGWASQVNVKRLELDDCFGCTLGQIFGSYRMGCSELDITRGCRSKAVDFGFHAAVDMPSREYEMLSPAAKAEFVTAIDAEHALLRKAWLAEIAARLTPDSPEAFVDESDFAPIANFDSPL